ncbi:MAG: CARDB domain-containing protein [Planctomycetota bacterium]
MPQTAETSTPAPAGAADGSITIYLPGGTPQSSVVKLYREGPTEVTVGQDFVINMEVTNITSDTTLRDVVLYGHHADDVEIVSSSPAAAMVDGQPTWSVGSLEPGQTATLAITHRASAVGAIVDCATVTYTPYACLAINVTEPALQLAKTMPSDVLACDPIPVRYVVTNSGSGPATGVEVRDELPDGLVVAGSGRKVVVAPVGTLAPGESKAFEVTLEATETGTFVNNATATGTGNLAAEDSAEVSVTKPELAIAKTGPAEMFVGRSIDYTIGIANTGDGEARDTVVVDTLPANATLVSASDGGVVNGQTITWNVGTLAPGAEKEFTVEVRPTEKGEYTNSVMARAYCAETVEDVITTDVKGIPAVLLEVVDAIDPVEVGTNTTYVITVTNQGSAIDRDIDLKVTLEEGAEFVSGTGPTEITGEGNIVDLLPLEQLLPKQKATWQIVVRAADTGDKRFRVEMDTAQLTRPVFETEATNFYE